MQIDAVGLLCHCVEWRRSSVNLSPCVNKILQACVCLILVASIRSNPWLMALWLYYTKNGSLWKQMVLFLTGNYKLFFLIWKQLLSLDFKMKKRLTEWPLQHILPVFRPFLPGQALFAWWQRLMTMEYACTMEIPQHLLSVLVWKRRWFDRKLRIPDAHQTLDELLNIYRHFINWRNLCLGYKECGKKGELGRRKRSIHSFVWSRIWVRSTGFIFILFSESTDMIHIIDTPVTYWCYVLLSATLLPLLFGMHHALLPFSTLKYTFILNCWGF